MRLVVEDVLEGDRDRVAQIALVEVDLPVDGALVEVVHSRSGVLALAEPREEV